MGAPTDPDDPSETNKPKSDAPVIAHIARSEDIVRSHVMGEELTALCGVTFVPSRDPEGLPLCRKCQTFLTILNDLEQD